MMESAILSIEAAVDGSAVLSIAPLSAPAVLDGDSSTPATLDSLPFELLLLLARVSLSGHDALSLGRCSCTFREVVGSDSLWREKLERDCGFTAAGFELWESSQRSLRQAWIYFTIKHEPLEASLLRDPQCSAIPGWQDCMELKLCVELANPWPVKVWTLFRVCPPNATPWAVAAKEQSLPVWSGSEERIRASGYAAPGDRDAIVVSIAAADQVGCRRPGGSRAFGWMEGVKTSRECVSEPAVQAMLLPSRAKGAPGVMVVLGEHCIRIDHVVWTAAEAAGEVTIEVLQCVNLCAHGLDLPLEDASPVELCSDAGAEVLTTADVALRRHGGSNRMYAGRAFEWRPSAHRQLLEAEHRHETQKHICLPFECSDRDGSCAIFPGSTCVLQGGWELPDETVRAPPVPAPVTFTTLSRTRAVVPLRW